MPIYEYQCDKCGHHLEALQKISDKPLRECPECGRHTLKRLMSAPLFRLAGSGWYETDFKSENERKRNLVGDTAEAESTADAKSDAKPAAKPAANAEPKKESKPARTTVAARPAAKKPAGKAKPSKKAARKASRR